MLYLAVFLLAVAAANAQTCTQCDTYVDDRSRRTGCRIFCFFSAGRDELTKADLQREFDNMKNADGVVEQGPFTGMWMDRTQMCSGEADLAFLWFATRDPTSDPSVITQSDLDMVWLSLSNNGASPSINFEDFMTPHYTELYAFINDPTCTSGR